MNNEFELPEIFDPSQYAGTTDLVPIPPGWQSAHIVEASYKEVLNNSTSTYMLAVFEIIEGEHKGRKIFQNVTLTNRNQQAVEIGQQLFDQERDDYRFPGAGGHRNEWIAAAVAPEDEQLVQRFFLIAAQGQH